MRKMTRRVKQKVAESGKLNPSVLSWSQEAAAGDFSTRQHKPLKNLESTKGNPTNTTSNEQDTKMQMATEQGNAAAKENARCPTLRDLCPEDKRRVKNLVEEVARLGTEKERMELEMVRERAALQSLLQNLHTKHHQVVKEKKKLEIELTSSKLQLNNLRSDQPSGHVTDMMPSVIQAHLPSINPLDMRLSPSKHIHPTTHLNPLSCSGSQLAPMMMVGSHPQGSHAPPAQLLASAVVPDESIPHVAVSKCDTQLHHQHNNASLISRDAATETNEATASIPHVTGSKGATQLQYQPTDSHDATSYVKHPVQYTYGSVSTSSTNQPFHLPAGCERAAVLKPVISYSDTEETLKPVGSYLVATSSTGRDHMMTKKQELDHTAAFQDDQHTLAHQRVGVFSSSPEDGYRNMTTFLHDHKGSYSIARRAESELNNKPSAHREESIFKSAPQISLVDISTQTLNQETKGVQTECYEERSDTMLTNSEHGKLTPKIAGGLRSGGFPHGTPIAAVTGGGRAEELPHETTVAEVLLHENLTSKAGGGLLHRGMVHERLNSNKAGGLLLESPGGMVHERLNSGGLLHERPGGMLHERLTSNKAGGLLHTSSLVGVPTSHPHSGETCLLHKSSLEERSSSRGIESDNALSLDELSAPVSTRTARHRNPYGIISGAYKSNARLSQPIVSTCEYNGVRSPVWDVKFEPVSNADSLAVSALLNEQDTISSMEDLHSCGGSVELGKYPEAHRSQCEVDTHLSSDFSPLQPVFTLNHTLEEDISCDSLGSERKVLAAKWSNQHLNSRPPSRSQPHPQDKEQLQAQTCLSDDQEWNWNGRTALPHTSERHRAFRVSSKVNGEDLHSQEERLRQALKRGRSYSDEVDQLVEGLFFLDKQN